MTHAMANPARPNLTLPIAFCFRPLLSSTGFSFSSVLSSIAFRFSFVPLIAVVPVLAPGVLALSFVPALVAFLASTASLLSFVTLLDSVHVHRHHIRGV